MVLRAQSLLSSLVANAVLRNQSSFEDTEDETEEGMATLEVGGVEIIVKNGDDGHAHAVYPHFDDKPRRRPSESCGSHCHVAYPVFDSRPPGLICENAKNDAFFRNEGVEIIARDDPSGHCTHAVYPHFGDRPEERGDHMLGSHSVFYVYPHFGDRPEDHRMLGSHSVYSVLSDNPEGLICENMKNDSVVENPSHAVYSVLGDNSSGLICENAEKMIKNDALVKYEGIEVIARNEPGSNTSHAIYPHFGDRPEANGVLGSHSVYSVLSDNPNGLICENVKNDSVVENASHAVYSVLEDNSEGLICENVDNVAVVKPDGREINSSELIGESIESVARAGYYDKCSHAVYPHFGDRPRGDACYDSHEIKFISGDNSGQFIVDAMTKLNEVAHNTVMPFHAPMQTCTGCRVQAVRHKNVSICKIRPTLVAAVA